MIFAGFAVREIKRRLSSTALQKRPPAYKSRYRRTFPRGKAGCCHFDRAGRIQHRHPRYCSHLASR